MDKFLETNNLPKQNQEEAESLSTMVTASEIEEVFKKLMEHKSPGPDEFTEFYKTFKGEIIPILLKLFQKSPRRGKTSKLFHEVSIIIVPKPDKDTTRKENYRPMSLMNTDAKIINKY